MSGIFGNHPLDRWREKQLDDYLDKQEDQFSSKYPECDFCGFNEVYTEWETTGARNELMCPKCGLTIYFGHE